MKEHVEYLEDSFVDFEGKVHHFTLAAWSGPSFKKEDFPDLEMMFDVIGIPKCVKLGIAICNPKDTYNIEVGKLKALARAKANDLAIMVSKPGYVNTKLVQAFLEQEADYIKSNPEQYIPGYAEKRDKYLYNKRMEEIAKTLSPLESEVAKELQKNPSFFDKVLEYLKWLANRQ